MQKICAYCNNVGDLTREHIFPSSIISREKKLLSLNDKTDVYFISDLTIKDVCSTCNNGKLPKLDGEFAEVFNKFILEPIAPGSGAKIAFNYTSLLRFLLKVSYNSARASTDGKLAVETLKSYVPFILGDTVVAKNVELRLQIFTSAKKFNTVTNKIEGIFEAKMLRSAKIAYDGPQNEAFLVRLIALNSFWFYLIIPISSTSRRRKELFRKGFENWKIQPGIIIYPNTDKIYVPPNKTSFIHPSILNGMIRKNMG